MGQTLHILHAVMPQGGHLPAGVAGLGWPVSTLTHQGFELVISTLTLRAEQKLQDLVEDTQTAQTLAMAHNQLLSLIAAGQDCIPISLGAAYPSQDALITSIQDQTGRFHQALAHTQNCVEYSVRLISKPQAAPSETPSTPASGRDYLKARLKKRRAKEGRDDQLAAYCERLEAAFTHHAKDVVHLGGRMNPETGERRVFDSVYLVPRTQEHAFIEAGRPIYEESVRLGLEMDVSGPWAVYHFTGEVEDAA